MNELPAILLAEDLEEDIILIQKALEKGGIKNPLFIVRDGEQVMNYLSGTGRFSDRNQFPLPALLLLDLKMPGADGFDVLRWISTQPYLKSLRTVVLTSSELIRDVDMAYKLGASSFLVKPMDFQNAVEMAKNITHYWLRMNMTSGPTVSAQAKQRCRKRFLNTRNQVSSPTHFQTRPTNQFLRTPGVDTGKVNSQPGSHNQARFPLP